MTRLGSFARDVWQLARALRRGEPPVSYDELRRSEQLYRLLAENARDIIWLMDFPARLQYVSPACQDILGWSPDVQVTRREGLALLTDASAEHAARILADAIGKGLPSVTYEAEHVRADGSTVWCDVHMGILYDEDGVAVSTVGVTRDISEQRMLREQLAKAQKAEAIGTLAGGVAHDFNNFLTVIIGSLEFLHHEGDKEDEKNRLVDDALDAAGRAAALSRQLLALSRNQPASIEPLDVNALVRRADSLMRRVLGERIQLEVALEPGLAPARADENQTHQIILNLLMNARDAIDGDGCIRVQTTSVSIDRSLADAPSGLIPGSYVKLAVSDDGRGMDEALRRKAREPFFSTKAKGRGTGLGLAMVGSILGRIGGELAIQSEPGVGTTVEVYLPVAVDAEATLERLAHVMTRADGHHGDETILIVEDEDAVRTVSSRMLRQAGYRVHTAPTPTRALELVQTLALSDDTPALVVTDLVMPGMQGTEFAARLRESHPSMRFVVMSGYAESADPTSEALPGPLVTKPFRARELLRAVRSALDR